jgi:hypothetical protein
VKKSKAMEESWPASKTELWALERIIPYPGNPRQHSPEQVDLIARSMKDDGVTSPILVDEDGVIIYGHGRRLAAEKNAFAKYPVVVARGWSEEQKRAYRIKDNSYALLSTWSPEFLKIELNELSLAGYEMPLLGFDDVQLVSFISGINPTDRQQRIGDLSERFGIPPFSILNAREGWWQDRKRAWLSLGIQSELGRGENLLKMSDTMLQPDPVKRAERKAKQQEAAE